MAKHTPAQIRSKTDMVKKVMKHHFGSMPKNVRFKPAGLTNFVFEAECKAGKFIVRIASDASKLNDYIKEQWAVERVSEKGVPVAEILEVGNEIIPFPYMLQRKLDGSEALHHPERLSILKEMGHYTRLINSISTSDFGNTFDWSKNRLSKNTTWKSFLQDELRMKERIQTLEKNKIIDQPNLNKLKKAVARVEKWKATPSLNHGDIRLKNVITNEKGKILAIIDWENCTSNISPYWDLSIALHDLSIDGKQSFLEGYGIHPNEYKEIAYGIKVFNVLNYTSSIERFLDKKNNLMLDFYRLRLNGYLDMFSF